MQTEWQTRSLDECLESEFPGEWGDTPASRPANALVLRSTNLDDEGHVDLAGAAPRVVPRSKLAAKRLREGDILLEASGGGPGKPVGRVALFQPDSASDYLASNFFRTLRPDPKVAVPAFLTWRLQHLWRSPRIWTYQQQTTGITNLNVREYLSSEFEMPPCPEQSCVAAILDTLDETIRRSRDLIAKLKLIKQGLLRDLLTRGIDHTGRLRPAPATAPHAYQHSTAGLIPAEWETSTFGEQVEFRGGFGFSDRFQGLAQGDLPFFKVSDMSKAGNEKLLQKANNYVSRTTASRQGWSPAPPGGVAFAKVGAALLLNRRRILSSDSLVDNNMMVAVAGPSLDPTWLYWWLQTVDFGAFVQPGALPSVNQGQLGSLQIAYPDLREQRTIATVLDTSDSRIASERQGFDKLRALKSGLLEDLLSGRVSVSVPDEGLV